VLVNTKRSTPAATAASSSVSVPITFVSMKSRRRCEPMCGLCSVAACTIASTPSTQRRTSAASATEPTTRGVRRREHVEPDGVRQDAHERLAEMPRAAG
jgi:hypothetical protein